MYWIYLFTYILPIYSSIFKQDQGQKSNCYGSLMCGPSMTGSCWQAISKYQNEKYYTKYTSRTESDFGFGSGCTIIYTCDSNKYLNVSGKTIKEKARNILKKCQEDPGIPCGSEYFEAEKEKCRVTVNYCADCNDRG